MTPIEFLQFSIRHKCYQQRSWIISVLAVTQETEAQKVEVYPGKLLREPFGLFVINDALEKIKLEGVTDLKRPLFTVKDPITITPEWLPSVTEKSVETTVGCMLLNAITLVEPFGAKYPYRTGRFGPEDIEADIAPKLESTLNPGETKDPAKFYVDELLVFHESVAFMETLAQVVGHSITQVGLMPAPGIKEFKKTLLVKYKGKLENPVEMARFEKELGEFDDAYLKSDPAYGKFMAGKKVKGSRMKLFMTQGGVPNSFIAGQGVTPVISSLDEGVPTDPEGFTAICNESRYGSFSRGAETINGGVTAKGLMRAADSWRITEGDCGVTEGIRRLYRKGDTKHLLGRYIIAQGKPVLIETLEQAAAYDAREISVRSPQYCRRPGTQTCEVCAGKALSKFPTGTPIPLMEVSGGILLDSLKKMHNSSLSTEVMSLAAVIT